MKIPALPSVIFATLVIVLRTWLVTALLLVLLAPAIALAQSKPRVAVLYFDNNSGDRNADGNLHQLSKGFADMLITDLSSSNKVTVVEREKLQALLDEGKLTRSKFFDPKTAVKIGKGLGATHVVAGAFMTAGAATKIRIDVRLIEISTATVVLTAKVLGATDKIFELEQELVGKFLKNFGIRFLPDALPPTKVPNVKALASYSRALGLVDLGEDAQAAAQFKAVVSMAPAFALARTKLAQILGKIASAKSDRGRELDRGVSELYQHARSYLNKTKKNAGTLDAKAASYRLGYRMLLRHEASVALYSKLKGRSATLKIVPRKGNKSALKAMRQLYEVERQLIVELGAHEIRFPSSYKRFDLPDDDRALARKLNIKYDDGSLKFTMLRYLLDGRVAGTGLLKNYTMSPAPADLDPRLQRAALAMARAMSQIDTTLPAHRQSNIPVRALQLLAEFHIGRERIEEGIAEFQKILDNFPTLGRWSFYEKRIHQQLGLTGDHLTRKRHEYAKALKTCEASKINASIGPMLSSRMRYRGMRALPEIYKEVAAACKASPKFSYIQKVLYRNFTSRAGMSDDCEFLDRYEKKWIAAGGSQRSAALIRKRYVCN